LFFFFFFFSKKFLIFIKKLIDKYQFTSNKSTIVN